MNYIHTKKSILLSLLLAFIFLSAYTAHATEITTVDVDATKNDFVLEPGKAELFLNPGETVTRNVYITNRVPGTTKFKIEVEDFIGSRDPKTPVIILDGEHGPYSSKDFIIPETKEFSLNFAEKISIPVKITIPEDAPPGGYYSSVLVSNQPSIDATSSPQGAKSNTKIISRIGTLFFVRVNGDAKESGNLEDFKFKVPRSFNLYEKGPFNFEILFNNDGNVHLVPYGTVTFKNFFGKVVGDIPVDGYFSLPNSLRYREATWDKTFLFGRYKAILHLNRGYKGLSDERTLVFWVLPWKIIALILGGLLVLIGLIVFIVKNFEFKRKR